MSAGEWRTRLKATGRTDTELARRLNKTKSALSRIMTGERKDLRQSEIEAIEIALAEFEGKPQRPAGQVPLLGYAGANGSGVFLWDLENPMGWVDAPPLRDSATQSVAVRVPNDMMDPRLFAGELIYVGLGIAPARNGDTIFEFMDGTAMILTYAGSRQGHIFGRQYNPDEECRFEATKVRNLHAVTMRL